jgi:centrosomal protein CEP290
MDARNLMGKHDTSLYLKAQVDNLTGHNEELRRTLREIRFEATKANVDLDKAQRKVQSSYHFEVRFYSLL